MTNVLAWIYVAMAAAGCGLWLILYLSPSRRANFRCRLDPDEPDEEAHTGSGTADAANPADSAPRPGESKLSNQPSVLPEPGDASQPQVAIICPGRNEANWIRTTLPELCQQDYGPVRVLYIDDHSDDETPAITTACMAEHDNLIVLRNEIEPPAGWVGKCWAIKRGVETLEAWESEHPDEPKAEWFCFTDADIHWDPRCLRFAMAHASEYEADLVAMFPNMDFGTRVEKLGVLTMVLALGVVFPFKKAMDPEYEGTVTGGAFMLTRRSAYESINGHHAVANYVVEDINLGRKLKAAGARVRIALTRELMHCRMYEGFADMWEGLTKNAYAAMEYKLHYAAGLVAAAAVCNVLPPILLVVGIVWTMLAQPWAEGFNGDITTWLPAAGAALAAVTTLIHLRVMNAVRKFFRLHPVYAASLAPGSALYLLFVVASVWRFYRGGNVWKGRSYGRNTVATPPTPPN